MHFYQNQINIIKYNDREKIKLILRRTDEAVLKEILEKATVGKEVVESMLKLMIDDEDFVDSKLGLAKDIYFI